MSGPPLNYDRSGSNPSNYSGSSGPSATSLRSKKGNVDYDDPPFSPYSDSYGRGQQAPTQTSTSQRLPSTHHSSISHVSSASSRGVNRNGRDRSSMPQASTSQLQVPNARENLPSDDQHIRAESFSYSRYPEVVPRVPELGLSVPSKPSGRSSRSYPAEPVVLHAFLQKPPIMLLKRTVDRNTEQTHMLGRPATSPPVDVMPISSSLFPWIFSIQAHPRIGYLSIADLLNGIYKALQEPITESEYKRLDRARAKAVEAAYFKRIDQESARSREPIKRIDWLEGRYVFEGLVRSDTDHNAWILRLGWPPRYR